MLDQPLTNSIPILRVLHRSDALVAAELGSVCILFWRKTPTRATFNAQKSALDNLVARVGAGVAVICVVEPGADPPDEELRKASSITDHGNKIKAVALVIEGNGFRAAITRTVLSGITFMIRTPVPIKFFVTPKQAAAWVSTRVPVAGASDRFADQVENVRSHFSAPAPR
jgi:hypothetical protein